MDFEPTSGGGEEGLAAIEGCVAEGGDEGGESGLVNSSDDELGDGLLLAVGERDRENAAPAPTGPFRSMSKDARSSSVPLPRFAFPLLLTLLLLLN